MGVSDIPAITARKLTEYTQKTHRPFILSRHWEFLPTRPNRMTTRDANSSLALLILLEQSELYFVGVMYAVPVRARLYSDGVHRRSYATSFVERVSAWHVLQGRNLLRQFGGRDDFPFALPRTHRDCFEELMTNSPSLVENTWHRRARSENADSCPAPRSEVQCSTYPRDHAGGH